MFHLCLLQLSDRIMTLFSVIFTLSLAFKSNEGIHTPRSNSVNFQHVHNVNGHLPSCYRNILKTDRSFNPIEIKRPEEDRKYVFDKGELQNIPKSEFSAPKHEVIKILNVPSVFELHLQNEQPFYQAKKSFNHESQYHHHHRPITKPNFINKNQRVYIREKSPWRSLKETPFHMNNLLLAHKYLFPKESEGLNVPTKEESFNAMKIPVNFPQMQKFTTKSTNRNQNEYHHDFVDALEVIPAPALNQTVSNSTQEINSTSTTEPKDVQKEIIEPNPLSLKESNDLFYGYPVEPVEPPVNFQYSIDLPPLNIEDKLWETPPFYHELPGFTTRNELFDNKNLSSNNYEVLKPSSDFDDAGINLITAKPDLSYIYNEPPRMMKKSNRHNEFQDNVFMESQTGSKSYYPNQRKDLSFMYPQKYFKQTYPARPRGFRKTANRRMGHPDFTIYVHEHEFD